MDIGAFASEVLKLLPVPFVALEAVPAAAADLRVAWANPPARDRFGPDIEGSWLDRDRPFGPMGSIVAETEACMRDARLAVVSAASSRPAPWCISAARCCPSARARRW